MEPDLVTTPFDAELEFTSTEEEQIIQLKQDNKIDELFRMLFIKQCNALNELLPALFEKTNDYTEILLNLSVIDQEGVVYHLVHDIPEEDFDVKRGGQVEIIGWLYQYYNTEQNELVYDGSYAKVKVTKELLPAATTIYTPDWAVRYMVENSLGKYWVEISQDHEIPKKWNYYIQSYKRGDTVAYQENSIENIKLIDPCMGSGHILVYAFDVFMQIYESAGYSQREAAKAILENNIYGLDIDDRAFQIAYFAIMMKARQYNRRILDKDTRFNLYSVKESNGFNRNHLNYLGAGFDSNEKKSVIAELNLLLDTFIDAKEFGSILKCEKLNWQRLREYVNDVTDVKQMSFDSYGLEESVSRLLEIIELAEIITNQYQIVITIVTSDHGFIYKREKITESDKISGINGTNAYVNRRFVISDNQIVEDGIGNMSLGYVLGNNDQRVVSYPISSNVFKTPGAGQNYVHGGSSPQEMIVPVVNIKMEKGHMETTNVQISLVSMVQKITNLITTMDFIQSDPVSDTVKAATYKMVFMSEDGERISNENIYVADSREPDSQKRIFRMRFNFKNKSYDKSKQYYLVVYDANTEIEAFRHPVIMDLAFADDFGW